MGLIVGSARSDEHGGIVGGQAGDQKGGAEVSTQPYYMHEKGWYCLRPKTDTLADNLADCMVQACNNNHIGYTQDLTPNGRYGCVNAVKNGIALGQISYDTATDCSALVRACCMQAGGFDAGDFSTSGEVGALERTGKFEPHFSVDSSTVLFDGDILVTKTSGHTVIVVSGNPRTVSKYYRVQCGAFHNKSYADTMLANVKAKGHSDAYIVEKDGYYKVQVGAYEVKTNADSMLSKMKSEGFDAFITE